MSRLRLATLSAALFTQMTAGSQPAGGMLEEVIVTARRIAEPVASLPLAVDVVAAPMLAPGGVTDLGSLALELPGFSYESLWGGIGSAPVLRGQSQPSTAGDNVGVFVDDIYQAGRSGLDVPLLDLERIEVLRGPQNTQFGRSTFAGAIRLVPRQPTAEPSGSLQAQVGSDALLGAQVAASRRLLDSPWLGRAALGLRRADGVQRSTAGESLGDLRQRSAALTLARESADAAYRPIVLSLRFQDALQGHPASSTLNAADFNCGAQDRISGLWSYFCGPVPVARNFSLTPGIPDSHGYSGQASLRLERDLGDLALRSLTGYYTSSSTAYRDFDGSSGGLFSGVCTINVNCQSPQAFATVTRFLSPNVISRPKQSASEWSQELRLGSEDTMGLRWMTGLAASRGSVRDSSAFGVDRSGLLPTERLTAIVASNSSRVGSLSPLNSALVSDSRQLQLLQSASRNRSDTLAAFGMVDMPLSVRSRARLELRAEREKQRITITQANYQPSTAANPEPVEFTVVLPRLSVDLQASESWYGYASLARGARSGGINTLPGLDEEERTFHPEYNWTSEMGLRFQGHAAIQAWQATVYRIDWRNTQIIGVAATPGVSSLITRNTAGVTTHGLETQLQIRIGRAWTGRAAFSWTQPRFVSGSDDAGSRAFCGLTTQPPSSTFCEFGAPRSSSNGNIQLVPYLDGNLLSRVPRRALTLGLQSKSWALAQDWQLNVGGQFAWQDSVYERPINGARYGGRRLLGLRAGLERQAWRLELWGTNLTDERYVRVASGRGGAFYPSLPRPIDLLYGEGRRIGLTVTRDLSISP